TLAAVLRANPRVDFTRWHLFLADERCVPLDHEDSNYRLVKATLLDHLAVPVPPAQVHPIPPHLVGDPAAAAKDYQAQLTAIFGAEGTPVFDLILLGMGPDGHTCSLFPGHPLLLEDKLWVTYLTDSPKPPPSRITLTYPVLNAARSVVFVTTGESKADVLVKILRDREPFPSGLVSPPGGVTWMIDTKAASKLPADLKNLL
ncbi:6-phosphogluconolactonase, partial [Cladochytrium tenue]